jgi:pentatricopeptide repeat protein
MVEAHRLFKGFQEKKVITWNSMVRCYIRNQLHAKAADFLDEMQVIYYGNQTTTTTIIIIIIKEEEIY